VSPLLFVNRLQATNAPFSDPIWGEPFISFQRLESDRVATLERVNPFYSWASVLSRCFDSS
jgi:hypothetical protein